VQVLTEIEAVLQHLLTVMDEQVVNSLRSHPPYPPFFRRGEEAIERLDNPLKIQQSQITTFNEFSLFTLSIRGMQPFRRIDLGQGAAPGGCGQ
jgi:hypothetical protein